MGKKVLFITILKCIFISVFTFGLYLFFVELRKGLVTFFDIPAFAFSASVGCFLLFVEILLGVVIFKKLKVGCIAISVWLGISVIEIPIRVLYFSTTLVSFPNYLFWCFGILMGYLYAMSKKIWQRVSIIIVLIYMVLFVIFKGYDLWLNKISYDSFTGKVNLALESPLVFMKPTGEEIKSDELCDNFLVLDFWSTRCGYCYRTFPLLDEIYNKYANDTRINIIAVHCWNMDENENFTTGNNILTNYLYAFPVLGVEMNSLQLERIGVTHYPTVVIVNHENKIVFRGSLEYARKYIEKLLGQS